MTDHTGFEADLEVLTGIADQTMPQVAQTISTASFADSVAAAAGRLHGIAENYRTIDDSLAGE